MKPSTLRVVAVMAAAVSLAACGGGKDISQIAYTDTQPTVVSAGATTPSAAAPATPAATTPAASVAIATIGASALQGPAINSNKYASVDPAFKFTTNRVASVWNYPGPAPQYWYPCEQGSRPDCQASPGNIANVSDIGAFRETMPFAGMSNDDPIVYPGQPGKSHSHTFFGNLVDANTTSQNIRNSPWCASAGGKLNCTSVWIPTVVDTLDGTPVVPGSMNFYYKGSYELSADKNKNIVPVPVGLHMVSGNPANTNPSGAVSTGYLCLGPNGENPGWRGTITAAVADGTCLPGGELMIAVTFPYCWDGVNLDSPDHISHMSGVEQIRDTTTTPWSYPKRCPATHPKQIPSMSVNAHYPITSQGQVARWRLASDMYDAKLPAGLSGHADYMMGWDPTPHPELWGENKSIAEMWTSHCLNEQRDCHNFLIGDNKYMLY